MRGKVAVFCCAVGAHGITPAYAGKSHSATPCSPAVWDHPRVCGEKIMERQRPDRKGGSPPRMRGKDLRDLVKMPFVRITPAYAGKRAGDESALATPGDHPRVCGEKLYEEMERGAGKGSPPRMRGKALRGNGERSGQGITPAYAGKSTAVAVVVEDNKDHPRVCGEKDKES